MIEPDTPDPPGGFFSRQKRRFNNWLQEWKDAFEHTKKPWKYSKKEWAIDFVSSLRSYAVSLIAGAAMWFKTTFPWFVPMVKSFFVKVWTAILAGLSVLFQWGS